MIAAMITSSREPTDELPGDEFPIGPFRTRWRLACLPLLLVMIALRFAGSAFRPESASPFGGQARLMIVLLGLSAFAIVALSLFGYLAFLLTLALAVVLNFLIFYCFSAMSFWLVEVGFLFEGIRIVTILLSGGIFPLEVFGERFVQLMNLLPFKYTVSYPVNVLNGTMPPAEVVQGMLIQCFWIAACCGLAQYLWRVGGRRYVAVGG